MAINSLNRQIYIEHLLLTWPVLGAEDIAVNDADKILAPWKVALRETVVSLHVNICTGQVRACMRSVCIRFPSP